MAEDEASFLRRRAEEEDALARGAGVLEATKAHLRFAAAYRARLAALERADPANHERLTMDGAPPRRGATHRSE